MVDFRPVRCWDRVVLLRLTTALAWLEIYGRLPGFIITNPADNAARVAKEQGGWRKFCTVLNTAMVIWTILICSWMSPKKLKAIRSARWGMQRRGPWPVPSAIFGKNLNFTQSTRRK